MPYPLHGFFVLARRAMTQKLPFRYEETAICLMAAAACAMIFSCAFSQTMINSASGIAGNASWLVCL